MASTSTDEKFISELNENAVLFLHVNNISWAIAILAMVTVTLIFFCYRFRQSELAKLDEIKARFFANISHELRTPLSLIIGPLENKLSKSQSKEDRDQLVLMKRNADRLLELTTQILDLSKLEAGKLKLQVQKADYVEFLKTLITSMSPLASVRGISLESDVPKKSLEVFFDIDKCRQILSNILSNALKFTPDGGVVMLIVTQTPTQIIVSIEDSGLGIKKDEQKYIFNRYYQSHESKYSKGTGIGLALAKELAILHHGNINVGESSLGGAKFIFELPLLPSVYRDAEFIEADPAKLVPIESTAVPK